MWNRDSLLAFMDINPLSAGHCLVIPKKHGQKLADYNPEDLADLGPTLVRLSKAVGAENYNVLQNNGKLAHQEVQHVHFHIIPRTPDSGLNISGRWQMIDPKPDLTKVAEEIKGRL